jgi:hypothetical protein
MGLGTDLATVKALQTSLQNDGASAAVMTEAANLATVLNAQLAPLQSDLASAQTLLTSLTTDGANATVLADMNQLIKDLTLVVS